MYAAVGRPFACPLRHFPICIPRLPAPQRQTHVPVMSLAYGDTAGPAPHTQELQRCTVRPWRLSDAPSLAANLNDRSIWLCIRNRVPHPYTKKDALEFLQTVTAAEGPPEVLAIEVDGQAVGAVGIHMQDPAEVYCRSAELGYWLGRRYHGRGIASEAVAAAIDAAWACHPHLNRIYAHCYAPNAASQAVLRKLGFQQEGLLRQAVCKDGRLLDELAFGLLRHEWRGLRQAGQPSQAC